MRAQEISDQEAVDRDRAVLEALYYALDGPNWVNNTNWLSDEPLDQWHGVLTDHEGRVAGLALYSRNLFGSIPVGGPSLRANEVRGRIPPEIGQLDRLQGLVLSNNRLSGPIPPELGQLTELRTLQLDGNQLTGPIPPELGNLANLRSLVLMENALTGPIPPELGRLANLEQLFLRSNALQGSIPPELGELSNLQYLDLRYTGVSGAIPPELGGLTKLRGLFLPADSGLNGPLPGSFTGLTALTTLRLVYVYLDAPPTKLCAPTDPAFQAWLRGLDVAEAANCVEQNPETDRAAPAPKSDRAAGSVDSDREALVALYHAASGPDWVFNTNWLSDRPLHEWYGVTTNDDGRVTELKLYTLDGNRAPDSGSGHVRTNGLSGRIPAEIGLLDQLTVLVLWANRLSGPMPLELGNLSNLERLELSGNWLSGPIPVVLGTLTSLYSLNLDRNRLSGPIPAELGDLSRLRHLSLSNNRLSGPIPPELGNLDRLSSLSLDYNQLHGPIPSELGNLNQLHSLYVNNNQLSGPIPAALGSLSGLARMSLSNNRLSGPIPDQLGNMRQLSELYLSGNPDLAGPLPVSFTQLSRLHFLALDDTQLCAHAGATFQAWLDGVRTPKDVMSCPGPTTNPDRDALVAFYQATGGPDWVFNTNWLSDRPLGEWYGVDTDGFGRVTQLMLFTIDGDKPLDSDGSSLTGNGLSGEVPASIGQLAELQLLLLPDSQLSGPLPDELGNLTELRYLYLAGNPGLSGPLPGSLSGLTQLSRLWLDGTQLCAPADWMFQAWLRELDQHEGVVNCVATGGISDREALTALYHTTDGPNWKVSTNWLSDRPLDEWHGVTTDAEGRVTELTLYAPDWGQPVESSESRGNGLRGRIPAELGQLDKLQRLDLRSNNLSGSIPAQLGSLSELSILLLDNNWLSGPIPTELGELSQLERLSLGNNNLSGPIPSQLGNLSELTSLRLDRNKLTGAIPVQLTNLSNLTQLQLERNRLSGRIPTGLGRLSKLQRLSLANNSLSGLIPPELAELTELKVLYLGANELSGPIPGELGKLSNLQRLYLSDSPGLPGPLPVAFSGLTSLSFLWLEGAALCAPADAAFQTWLGGLERKQELLDCPAPAPHADRDALVEFYHATGGPNWVFNSNWLSERPLWEWYGVSTNSWGRVTALALYTIDGNRPVGSGSDDDAVTGNGLRGSIPAAIGQLDQLEGLDLSGNPALSGPLPGSFTGLTALAALWLEETQLCAPADDAFQAWLEAVDEQAGVVNCGVAGETAGR